MSRKSLRSIVVLLLCVSFVFENFMDSFAGAEASALTSAELEAYETLKSLCRLNPSSSPFCSHLTTSKPRKTCIPLPDRNDTETPKNMSLNILLSEGISTMDSQRYSKSSSVPMRERQAIFVLGNTGSGKTTATQIIAGNLSRIHATKTTGGSLVIIDDDGRIGAPTTTSKTLFPEYILNSEGVSFWDCPGFDDNRGPQMDIAAMYFLKYALDTTPHAKFLFTVNHSAVKAGNDRLDFDLLVTHAVRLLVDVRRLKDSIGLVVTKVGSYSLDTGEYQCDEEIMHQIKRFMSTYVETKRKQAEQADSSTEKAEIEKKVEFVNGILGVDNPNKESRVLFLRSPRDCGILGKMNSTLDSRQKIVQMYKSTLKYSVVSPADFQFTLKEGTRLKLERVFIPETLTRIGEYFNVSSSMIKSTFAENFYKNFPNNATASISVLNRTSIIVEDYLSFMHNNTHGFNGRQNIAEILHDLHIKLGSDFNTTMKMQFEKYQNQVGFFINISNEQTLLSLPFDKWHGSLRDFSTKLKKYQEFYEFCEHTKYELDRRQSMLMKIRKSKNITEEIENGNVLSFLEDNKFVRVAMGVKSAWNVMSNIDRLYLENLVKDAAFQISCKPIPPKKASPVVDQVSLRTILSDGLENMDSQRAQNLDRNQSLSRGIFMLGNTGSGKTTATQILAGNLSRLHAVYTESGSLVIVDDDDRIGAPTTKSKTLIPEYVIHPETGIAFWDCPGFDDNRGPILDIAAMKFLRHALDNTNEAIFLFTVAHSSVTVGNDRLDFDLMVTHATHLLRNVSRLNESIGLVVTKVGSYSKFSGDFMEDDEILAQIRQFLESYVITQEQKCIKANTEIRENLKSKISFVRHILEENEMGQRRLYFLRSPEACGNLGEMQLILETRRKMATLYRRNLSYSLVTPGDFRFTLKAETLRQIQINLKTDVAKKLDSTVIEVLLLSRKEIRAKLYKKLYTGYIEHGRVEGLKYLNETINALQILLSETNNAKITNILFTKKLKEFHGSLGVSLDCKHAEEIGILAEDLDLFDSLTEDRGGNIRLQPAGFPHLADFHSKLQNLRTFLMFCDEAETHLAQYSSQLKFANLLENNGHNFNSSNVLPFLYNKGLVEISTDIVKLWTELESQEGEYLRNIVSSRWVPHLKWTCTSSRIDPSKSKLTISGRNVILTKAFNYSAWPKNCEWNKLKEISLIGAERVYFDQDILANGKELYISMVSSLWVITGSYKIILDGVAPEDWPVPPKNDKGPGINGNDGLRGGDSGSFYGIYSKIENGSNLYISVNAGNGGNGQDGGEGSNGVDGRDADINDMPSASKHASGGAREKKEVQNGVWIDIRREQDKPRRVKKEGRPGSPGRNGGNGGNAGTPGTAGRIIITRITKPKMKNNTVKVSSAPGSFGSPGKGGKPGVGGRQGRDLSCVSKMKFPFSYKWRDCSQSANGKRSPSGFDGLLGRNGTVSEESLPPFYKWEIIGEFKATFYLENSRLLDAFLESLHENQETLEAMRPISFAQEIIVLEEKTSQMNLMTDQKKLEVYSKHYHRILKWLAKYIKYHKQEGTLSHQDKAALNLIHGVVLSKLGSLRKDAYTQNVIKTKEYFSVEVENAKKLQQLQKNSYVQNKTFEFETGLITKVKEAEGFITNTVQPAIQNAYDDLKQRNQQFIEEINHFLSLAKVDLEAKEKAKENYENSRKFETVIGILNTVGTACQFLGKYGEVASSSIMAGTSVAQAMHGLITRRKRSVSQDARISGATSLPQKHVEYLQDKIQNTQMLINVTMTTRQKIRDDSFQNIAGKVDRANRFLTLLKASVESGQVVQTIRLETQVENSIKDVRHAVIEKAEQLEHENSVSRSDSAKFISGLAVAMETGNMVSGFVERSTASKAELERLVNLVEEAEAKVNELENLRTHFYEAILPTIDSTIQNMGKEMSKLNGQTHAGISVKEWRIKSLLRNMRGFLQQFTKGFQAAEQYQLSFETTEQAITLLIDLYEHIERYQEKKEFADFIANINSDNYRMDQITDSELRGVLANLEFSMERNVFVENYHKAMHAFKQWVFPFADVYLREAIQEERLAIAPTKNELVNRYTKQVEQLGTALAKYQATTDKGDESIIFTTFTSDLISSEPFYVWKNDNWQSSIRRLLSGEEIHLKADINLFDQSQEIKNFFQDKAAVKFKVSDMVLRVQNESRQTEMDAKLNHFHMEMTHSGISVYKVRGQRFIMLDKPQKYRYSFERTEANNRVSENGVKYKVSKPDADFLMSPYSWWTFKLIDTKPGYGANFGNLTEYANEVSLELQGNGLYLDEAHMSPSELSDLNLHRYYDIYESDRFPLESLANPDDNERCYF